MYNIIRRRWLSRFFDGLYFGTMKGWINEVEKHNGLLFKIVNKLKNKRKSLSSKTGELKLWSDRVVARLEYKITEGNISFSFSDKSTTGSQYVVLKQLKIQRILMELILCQA
ncbi:unnamed protein product [Rhizophagus irregularis]|uniref:Uncharacterized protein n=1 Tax=Rhizophagus irregularis TaxID=588596 RepID=A0A2I1HGU0_9GLOM|nr:hypothetical protein RhiirA4_479712 [Rhizophagus irregularis]CAB4409917.1 unnamed protein product [Rhizophagus irregularis]